MNHLKKIGKDEITVAKNFGYLSILQVAGYLFPIITIPYLARTVGTVGFGQIAFASAIIVWIQTISDWGFDYTATRDVAQSINDRDAVSHLFSDVLWARCILMIFSFVLLIISILIIPSFREHTKVILVTFLLVPGHILFPDWFFQALERMKYTTIFSLLIKFIFTIAVFLFIKKPEDYILQPLFTAIAYLICGFFSLWLIIAKWKYKLYLPDTKRIKKTIWRSTDVFINNIMPNFYNSFSVLLLGSISGNVSTGIFEGGSKFVTVAHQFQSAISRAFFPYLSRNVDNHSLYVKINLSVGVLLSSLLFVFSPVIINVMLGPDFSNSVSVLRILSVSLVFLSLSSSFGTNYLIIVHREKDLRKITVYASVLGLLVSYPLVKAYSYIGAAITILLCRTIIGVLTFLCTKQRERSI